MLFAQLICSALVLAAASAGRSRPSMMGIKARLMYPMIKPAIAMPPPPNCCGFLRDRLWAMCPIIIAGTPVRNEQPTKAITPRTRLAMARPLDGPRGEGIPPAAAGGAKFAAELRLGGAALAANAAANSGNH